MAATVSEKTGVNRPMHAMIANELTQQLGVLRLLKVVEKRQPISLNLLGAIFVREAEQEERDVVGNTLSDITHTMQMFSKIFVMERGSFFKDAHDVRVCLVDNANVDCLLLLSGVLKLKSILKQKGRLKIKQLSTFFNQQSSMEERKVMGRNPITLTQTVEALPSVFSISGEFISIKIDKPPESSAAIIPPAGRNDMSDCESQTYSKDAPISYASAVTARTVKDDENARARRTGLSKLRNFLAQFGTSTISQLFELLESRGTVAERQAVGKDRGSLQATLKTFPNIFAVSGQFVDLIAQAPRVTGLAKVYQFLKIKGSCEVVQITGFMGQQGTREEREAVGRNPQSLGETLLKFTNIFAFSGGHFSLKRIRQVSERNNIADGFGGITSSLPPSFLIKNRTRNESIGVDSGYEGSVTFDPSDPEGMSDKGSQPFLSEQYGSSRIDEASIHPPMPSVPDVIDNHGTRQPSFTMIDVANNNDSGFKDFKRECLDSCNEFDKPIIGLSLSDDHKWVAVCTCADKVYLVDLETCAADGSGDRINGVCNVLKDVLQSSKILKIVYDCRVVAAALHEQFGFNITNVFDTMRTHELLTCNDTASVDELCSKYEGVTPPNKWSVTIGGLPGWKVLQSGGCTSDIGLAASARVLVPHLYRKMVVRFTDEARLNEVLRLCEQIVQTSYI